MLWSEWLHRIERKLDRIIQQGVKLMSDSAALTQAVTDLQTEVGSIVTQMDSEFAALQAALSANNGPAITAATSNIQAMLQTLRDAAARDAMTAPPSPTVPGATPTVPPTARRRP